MLQLKNIWVWNNKIFIAYSLRSKIIFGNRHILLIEKYILLLNGIFRIERIAFGNIKCLIKGNQHGVFVIFSNHIPRVDVVDLNALLVTSFNYECRWKQIIHDRWHQFISYYQLVKALKWILISSLQISIFSHILPSIILTL